jgi:hypothetical protein
MMSGESRAHEDATIEKADITKDSLVAQQRPLHPTAMSPHRPTPATVILVHGLWTPAAIFSLHAHWRGRFLHDEKAP